MACRGEGHHVKRRAELALRDAANIAQLIVQEVSMSRYTFAVLVPVNNDSNVNPVVRAFIRMIIQQFDARCSEHLCVLAPASPQQELRVSRA